MSVKLNIIGRRRPGTTTAQNHRHFRHVHGEAVLEYIRVDPQRAPRRYVQNFVVDGTYRNAAAGPDPLALHQDLVSQLWFKDFEALAASRATPFYDQHLKDDEENFVDMSTALFLPCREVLVMGSAQLPPSPSWKLFVGLARAATASDADFDKAWSQSAEVSPPGVLRHVQNRVLGPAGQNMPLDAIDEFWVEREDSMPAVLDEWLRILDRTMAKPELVHAHQTVAYLAREEVLYAGSNKADLS